MIRNYIKIAFRNMTKNSVYSFINITGLSVGLTAFILIALWIQHELGYDRFHERADQLYRVVENQYYVHSEVFPVAVTPAPLSSYLKENFPEVENTTRVSGAQFLFQYNDVSFNESGLMTDPSFFEMFSFPIIKGDPKTVLSKVESIVISEKLANKYFPQSDPLGKVFRINNADFAVTGVFADVPENSHLTFDYVLPLELYIKFGWDSLNRWDSNSFYTYVQLRRDAAFENVNVKIKEVIQKNNDDTSTEIYLQPLPAIHLHSKFTADVGGHGDIQYVYVFSAIGVFVLIIACINFMNLSTARSTKRSKEVGVRKVVGAARSQLIRQFLAESIVFVFLALVAALVFAQLLLPVFNEISGKELALSFESSQLWIILASVMLITSIVAGSYPALFMSSFKPVTTLKGTLVTGKGAAIFRKVLVVTQFTISILLISGTLIVYNQLGFIRDKNLGFEKDNVLLFRANNEIRKNLETFKNELAAAPGVDHVTYCSGNLTYVGRSGGGLEWEGKDPETDVLLHMLSVDYDFMTTFNMELAEGRDFSKEMITDSAAIILNEEAILKMGLENPVNKKVKWGDDELTIIGIVKDFHFKSVHDKIEPLAMFVVKDWYNRVYVKLKSDDLINNVSSVEVIYKKFNPGAPFEYTFLNDDFDKLYRAEQRTGTIFNYFAIIAVFISCLGLFGLVMFTTEQRTKEIGIRKVLGASLSNLFSLISLDFIKLILISNVIAIPLAWYSMNQWLNSFAYRINIHWATFVLAAVSTILIAWLTMSYQSIKAATANPVTSLRNE